MVHSLIGKLQEDSIQGREFARSDFEHLLDAWVKEAFAKEQKPSKEQLETLKERMSAQLEESGYVRSLNIDHPDFKSWHDATLRYMRELNDFFPRDEFENRRANIPWQEGSNSPVTPERYLRGCSQTEGLLKDALKKIQEELDRR